MILLKNGCIHTMEQDFFKNGYLLIDGAKISAVGDMKDLKDVNADQVYDLEGAFVMPGMVDGHSHIGMWEDSLGFEGADGNEETDPVTPQMRALDAVNGKEIEDFYPTEPKIIDASNVDAFLEELAEWTK